MENTFTKNFEELLYTKVMLEFEFIKLPCHAQNVERIVKLVTESSIKAYGKENRDGFLRATLLSRSTVPSFDCKK